MKHAFTVISGCLDVLVERVYSAPFPKLTFPPDTAQLLMPSSWSATSFSRVAIEPCYLYSIVDRGKGLGIPYRDVPAPRQFEAHTTLSI